MLTATGFVNRRGQFLTPTESTPLDRSPKNLSLVITSATPTAVPNFVQIHLRGASGWNIMKILFIGLRTFFHQLTYRLDTSTDFHAWWLKWRGLAQRRAFGGGISLILHPILGVKYPQNPNFRGVNRRFQAKRAKYWKVHVIEPTASILTKFGTTIQTTKWTSCVVPICAQQIQDGGRQLFLKRLNCCISATVWPILMKLAWWIELAPYSEPTVKISNFWKSKMAAVAILKITKTGNGLTDLYKIWYADA